MSDIDFSSNTELRKINIYLNPITDIYIGNNSYLINAYECAKRDFQIDIDDDTYYCVEYYHDNMIDYLDLNQDTVVHTDLAKAPDTPTTSGNTGSAGGSTSGTNGGSTGATGSTESTSSTTPVNIDAKKVDGFATRLYTTCMCRPADAAGVDYWAKELSNMRRSGTQVAYEFFFSKEFIDYGVSDDEYINRLYQTFMGRAADDAGFAYWQGELKNSDRKTILYRFAGCQEFADICSAAGIIR